MTKISKRIQLQKKGCQLSQGLTCMRHEYRIKLSAYDSEARNTYLGIGFNFRSLQF